MICPDVIWYVRRCYVICWPSQDRRLEALGHLLIVPVFNARLDLYNTVIWSTWSDVIWCDLNLICPMLFYGCFLLVRIGGLNSIMKYVPCLRTCVICVQCGMIDLIVYDMPGDLHTRWPVKWAVWSVDAVIWPIWYDLIWYARRWFWNVFGAFFALSGSAALVPWPCSTYPV